MMHTRLLLCTVLLAVAGCAVVQSAADRDHGLRGKSIFRQYCIVCHGAEGRGDGWVRFSPPVADLTSERIKQKTDEELLNSLHEGRPNTAMGSWRLVLSPEERTDVVAYIRTLSVTN